MPDSTADTWQPRSRRRARVVAGGAVLLVLAGGGTAWGLTRGADARDRTAEAAPATVRQTLSATGTVSPVSHADESFQVSGTVARVAVKTGQHVRAGQVLAHLDRGQLRSALRSARSTLAQARSRMVADETGQSVTGGSFDEAAATTPTLQAAHPHVVATSPVSSQPPPTGRPAGATATGRLGEAQAAVRSAQQSTDAALGEASQALATANDACGSDQATPPPASGSPSASPDPTGSATPDPTASTPVTAGGDACTSAGAALLAAQQQVDRDEQQVSEAELALTKILTAMASDSSAANRGSVNAAKSQPSRSSTTAVSAADIALDQASIDQALATVDADRASLEQATLRATIAGRVAAVTVAHGDQVTASSSNAAFVIVGSRQEQVTVDLSSADIGKVHDGMTADVVADGSTHAVTGHVVSVDTAGVESSAGSVTFPVTIALPGATSVVSGAAASVTVVVASVADVLAVPTSAVHYSGTTTYVELLESGKVIRKTVKVAAVGAALTQITSGLTAGDRVVLADLNASVPSSSSNSSATFGNGGFTFPGGGQFVRRITGGAEGQPGAVTFGGPAG